jgi:drug/metabolite transporter (DMT)-like permease
MTDVPRSSRAVAVLVALGCVWGTSFLFIKVIVDEVSAMELVAGRLFLGAATILAFMALRRIPLQWSPSLLPRLAVLALATNVVPFALIGWAEEHIESGTASVLNSTMPLFTATFAAAVLPDERLTPARTFGLVTGFLGVVVLTGDDVLRITDADVLGQLAVVAAAACYGAAAVYMRTLLRSTDPISLSALQVTFGTIIAIPLVFAFGGTPDYSLSLEASLSLLALGVFGTGFGYIAYLWLIEATGSVRASLVTYIIPVVGLFLGWAVLDEGIGLNTIAGGVFIVAGVAMVMRGEAPGRETAVNHEGTKALRI